MLGRMGSLSCGFIKNGKPACWEWLNEHHTMKTTSNLIYLYTTVYKEYVESGTQ